LDDDECPTAHKNRERVGAPLARCQRIRQDLVNVDQRRIFMALPLAGAKFINVLLQCDRAAVAFVYSIIARARAWGIVARTTATGNQHRTRYLART
jgi:hypothetical protein